MKASQLDGRPVILFVIVAVACTVVGCAPGRRSTPEASGLPSDAPTPTTIDRVDACVAPTFLIQPAQSLQDEEVEIKLCGLDAYESITIEARMQLEPDVYWESSVQVTSDEKGDLELDDPMALIWSMKRHRGVRTLSHWSWPDPAITELTANSGNEALTGATLERMFMGPDVERVPVRDQGFVGTLFLPDDGLPVPAIIVLTESIDDLSERTAAMLASRGFATLALWYMRGAKSPGGLTEVPLEYFRGAIDWLDDNEWIAPDRLAVMGSSRGGELALLLAATFPEITAVVANVPSGVVWQGLTSPMADTPAWTVDGQPIPYLRLQLGPEFDEYVTGQILDSDPVAYSPWYLASMEAVSSLGRFAIPVEQIKGPVLLISGEDDQMWPSAFLADVAYDRLEQHDHPYQFDHLIYEDAGHLIIPPFWPVTQVEYEQPSTGLRITLGGTPESNSEAGAEAWERTLRFLDENLAGGNDG